MIRFLLRLAGKSALVRKSRFLGLTLTLFLASTLLVLLSGLYFNGESKLALELSGVPNIVVEPEESIVRTSSISAQDLRALKTEAHFWRNNIVTATPIRVLGPDSARVAATWFTRKLSIQEKRYQFGLLTFDGWQYRGREPEAGEVIVGANVEPSDEITVRYKGQSHRLPVAGRIETGSYWDDYVFLDFRNIAESDSTYDQILVSSLIKPKDELATRVEQYGTDALSTEEYERWYCSPYASSIRYTISEVIPQAEVSIQRRITGVQEGILQASSGVFLTLFILTLISATTAIFSAEKMYVSTQMHDIGIMAAMGASRNRILLQLFTEIVFAALISGFLSYIVSTLLANPLSMAIFGLEFEATSALLLGSIALPFLISLLALLLVRRSMDRDITELLR